MGRLAKSPDDRAALSRYCGVRRYLPALLEIEVTTAATLMATIGRIDRFASPRHLVGYLGLDSRAANPASTPCSTATS